MQHSFFPKYATSAIAAAAVLVGGFFSISHGATDSSSSRANTEGLSAYSKNLARLHLGATLMKFDADSRTFGPSEATPAWLDDDEATGWTPPTGQQYFLLALPEPAIVNHIAVSAPGSSGSVNLYIGDERATPDSSTWKPLARNLDLATLNEKLNTGAYSRYGRFVLIETNLQKSSPWWSLYVMGTEKAADYRIEPRVQKVDTRTLLGPNINDGTVFDMANLYSGARVTYVSNGGEYKAWQAMIDESPETFWILPTPEGHTPSMVIDYGNERTIRRISALVEPRAGVLEFFLFKSGASDRAEPTVRNADLGASSEFRPASTTAAAPAQSSPFDLEGRVPLCTLGFDGISDREAINFAPAEGRYLVVRWRGAAPGDNLKVRQIDSFGTQTFDEYALVTNLPAVAERRSAGDGKQVSIGKDYKMLLDPIAEGPLDPLAPVAEGPPLLGSNIPFLPPPLLVPPGDPPLITTDSSPQ